MENCLLKISTSDKMYQGGEPLGEISVSTMNTPKQEIFANAPVHDSQEAKDRLKELILHIAEKCAVQSNFGAVKLNKILYYADFLSFARYGEPITGAHYRSIQMGPVPISMQQVSSEMVASGDLEVRKVQRIDYTQHRYTSLRSANYETLKARDIALVDAVIDELCDRTAAQVSEMSHGRAWTVYRSADYIPYGAAFLSDEKPTEQDAVRAQELIRQHGWGDV